MGSLALMNRHLFSASIIAMAAMSAHAAQAQSVGFDAGGQPLVFNGSGVGSGLSVGSFRDYSNVITINGTQIDARVTLVSISGATLADFDSTANPYAVSAFFQPSLNISSVGGFARFKVDFTSGGQPVTLRNFYVNTYDLDGSGASANGRQFTDFSGFASYTLSSTTAVQLQSAAGGTRFITTTGGNVTAAVGTPQFNDIRARVFYTSGNSVTFTVGDTGATGVAYFGLDFSLGYAFSNAASDTTAPIVSTNQILSYSESQVAGTVVGSVAATDAIGVVNYRFAANNSQTSADGLYTIDNTGSIRLTPAGTAAGSATNDFEIAPNSFVYAVQASDAAGNWSSAQNITLAVLDIDDTAPMVAANQSFAYVENQTANATVGTVAASDAVGVTGFRFAATGTATSADGYYAIGTSGAIQLTAAGAAAGAPTNDFETTPNSFTYGIEARDAAGNWSAPVNVTLAVTDLADSAPVITGPSGGAGAAASGVSVNENQTAVATLTAGQPVTWSIIGGSDQGKFTITTGGVITFNAAPDFDTPTDSDTNNIYILTVRATDTNGNTADQTVTVTVLDIDDTAPVITGPSGGAGAAASAVAVNEGTSAVTSLVASEAVIWSLTGGADAAAFTIDSSTGALAFSVIPDFEKPADADRNNQYEVLITATDRTGNKSTQSVTVSVLDQSELMQKLSEMTERLRGDLRTYTARSLGDMLSFNERLMIGQSSLQCDDAHNRKPISGSLNANERQQDVGLSFSHVRDNCASRTRLTADGGVTVSRLAGELSTRAFSSVRLERLMTKDFMLGVGLMGSHASDRLPSFANSQVSDYSLQVNGYARYRIAATLRAGAFAGLGQAWYRFSLSEDGLSVQGTGHGRRLTYGGVLSGDVGIGQTLVTIDAAVSHARENVANVTLAATYGAEAKTGIVLPIGMVDTTRISVPATVQYQITRARHLDARRTELRVSPGLLCEDYSVDRSALQCGYQVGAVLERWDGQRGRGYLTYRFEHAGNLTRSLASLGYSLSFGRQNRYAISIEANQTYAARESRTLAGLLRLVIK